MAAVMAAGLAVMLPGSAASAAAPQVTAPRAFATPEVPGVLSITAPATATLPDTLLGRTTSARLGTVTVVDERIASVKNWVVTVTSTTFTTGAAGPSQTIPLTNVTYWSGRATATSGTGNFVPGQPTAANAVDLTSSRTAFSHTGAGAGNNSCSWNPTLSVAVPYTVQTGTYTATITHSVS